LDAEIVTSDEKEETLNAMCFVDGIWEMRILGFEDTGGVMKDIRGCGKRVLDCSLMVGLARIGQGLAGWRWGTVRKRRFNRGSGSRMNLPR